MVHSKKMIHSITQYPIISYETINIKSKCFLTKSTNYTAQQNTVTVPEQSKHEKSNVSLKKYSTLNIEIWIQTRKQYSNSRYQFKYYSM